MASSRNRSFDFEGDEAFTQPLQVPSYRSRTNTRGNVIAVSLIVVVAVAIGVAGAWVANFFVQPSSSIASVVELTQPDLSDQSGQEGAQSQESSQPEPTPAAQPAMAWVPVDVPTSLVIRRGAQVVLKADVIEEMSVVGYVVPPSSGNPAWLNNVGAKVGTDMNDTAWIVGHNIVGGSSDPFENLCNVLPGDIIEVTNRSGGTVYFRVNDGVGDQPGLGLYKTPKKVWVNDQLVDNDVLKFNQGSPGTIQLGSCTDDGNFNCLVNGTLIK